MRPNEFTHIPIKKQTAGSNGHSEELDIDFLDYEEIEKQTRPKVGRSTAARPEPRLQHPSKTPQRIARPAQQRPASQKQAQPTRPTQQRPTQPRPAQKRAQQAGTQQARPTAQRPQQTRPTQQRPTQPRPVQQRPTQPRPTQKRAQQAGTQQARPAAQRPQQTRPTQQRAVQQRPVQQRPVQQRQTQQRPQQAKRPVTQPRSQQTKKTKAPAAKGGFRKGLLIAWLAFIAVLAAALVLLTVFLSNYEKSRPTDTIHRIVSAVEKGNLDDLHLHTEDGASLTDGHILADPAEISAYILQKEEGSEEEEGGGISFRVINGESDENTKVYLIKALQDGRKKKRYFFLIHSR